MALGVAIAAAVALTDAQFTCPGSLVSSWVPVIDAGGMIVQDASAITNPTTQIITATRHLMTFDGRSGTLVCASMGYTGTPSANPVVAAFGRVVSKDGLTVGRWELLPNLNNATAVTLTTAVATDQSDGTNFYTACDPFVHTWDRRGCNQIVWGVTTIFATTVAGLAATAFLIAKAL